MKTYLNKVYKSLLFGLIIIAILGLIYLAIPKYQIHSVKLNENIVVITKINNITGKISTEYESLIKFPRTESGKLKFIND